MAFKRLLFLSLAFLTFACASINKDQISTFVPSLPDVPLPKDFEVDPTIGSFFDSADGRIADVYAASINESPEYVKKFYKQIMPQFGWQEVGELTFQKEGETLTIEPEKGDYLTMVKYQLRPTSN